MSKKNNFICIKEAIYFLEKSATKYVCRLKKRITYHMNEFYKAVHCFEVLKV